MQFAIFPKAGGWEAGKMGGWEGGGNLAMVAS